MAMGDVAEFVREYCRDFVRRIGARDELVSNENGSARECKRIRAD